MCVMLVLQFHVIYLNCIVLSCNYLAIYSYFSLHLLGEDIDFHSATQTAIITAGASRSTINITVINDSIVEGDEMFTMTLNVPTSPGITTGNITMATVTIIDSTSRLHHIR